MLNSANKTPYNTVKDIGINVHPSRNAPFQTLRYNENTEFSLVKKTYDLYFVKCGGLQQCLRHLQLNQDLPFLAAER